MTASGDTLVPHGHYADWYRDVVLPPAEAGRLLFVGLVRPYKNVPALVAAFADLPAPQARLHVAGNAADPALAEQLGALAAADGRVSLDLRHVPDPELAAEIGRAQLVVLPYAEMHNSGAVLLALSLRRPVLVPENAVNTALAAEVGERWVLRYDAP